MIRKILVLSVALIAVAALFLTLLQKPGSAAEEVEEIAMSLKVSDRLGFNVENSSLAFGSAPPGSSVRREMSVTNNANHSSRFGLEVLGALSGWANVSDADYVLAAGGNKTVGIVVNVPSDARFADYGGTLRVRISPA